MRLFAKASATGPNKGGAKSRGPLRHALASRCLAGDGHGIGAPSRLRANFIGLTSLIVLAGLALGASTASAATPVAIVGSVTEVKGGSAHVTGEVVPNGETFWTFEYSTDQANWNSTEAEYAAGEGPVSVSTELHGLEGSTTYHVRLHVLNFNTGEETTSAPPDLEFETLPVDPPVVLAVAAPTVAYTSATVTGEVERPAPANPDPAFDPQCRFEYITDAQFDANLGNSQPAFEGAGSTDCNHNPVTVESGPEVEAQIGGLVPATTYHLRLLAKNAGGTDVKEAAGTFATLAVAPPVVTLEPITDDGTTAHLSGLIDPGSANTDPAFRVSWHYECEPACSGLTEASGEFDDDGIVHPVPSDATVEANTDYTIKLIASNAGGTVSTQRTLHSQAIMPGAKTIPAFALGGGTEALLGGKVNPKNQPAEYWIEYGPGPGGPGAIYPDLSPPTKDAVVPETAGTGDLRNEILGILPVALVSHLRTTSGEFAVGQRIAGAGIPFGTTITAVFPDGLRLSNATNEETGGVALSAAGPQTLTQRIDGLAPATTYHFRIAAKNASGISKGEDVSFETLGPPTQPPATCPNEKLRSETDSENLGECRAYELVSPPDKNGGDVPYVLTSTPDGNRLAYFAATGFSESISNDFVNSYLARRTATGWENVSMQPKVGTPNLGPEGGYHPADFNAELTEAFNSTRSGAGEPNIANVFVTKPDGSVAWITSPTAASSTVGDKSYAGRSADGSRIIFESAQDFTGQGNGLSQVWEWSAGQVRLVSVLPGPKEETSPGAAVGTGLNGGETNGTGFPGTLKQPTVVSEDGRRIFFGLTGGSLEPGNKATFVFVREDGMKTRELDLSQRAGADFGKPPSTGSQFVGAAVDGSVVVFTSGDQLTDDATTDSGLYAYHLETGELRFLAPLRAPDGRDDAIGNRPVLVSEDGSHVFFTSTSVLVPGRGVSGGGNLYVADEDGVHYIATLGDEDAQAWLGTYNNGNRRTVAATPDGGRFLFQSYERLTSFDNAGHEQIYSFDSADETLTCVSCATGGAAATGDASMLQNPAQRGTPLDAAQVGRPRVISPDGRRILFQTTESLLPADVNGVADVYLYDDGQLSLISSGTSRYPSEISDITPDGHDIFFLTRDSFVGQDIDGGGQDIYDARIDGGFPAPPVATPCESQQACQGTASPAPGRASPATTAPARGNPPGPHKKKPHKSCKAKAKKHGKCVHRKSKKHRAKKHHAQKQGKNASNNGRGK